MHPHVPIHTYLANFVEDGSQNPENSGCSEGCDLKVFTSAMSEMISIGIAVDAQGAKKRLASIVARATDSCM